uniref:Stabilin 2 n=1 Tax=Myripristis murdjan TaxID=586833 RepID=A0A667ZJM3_9TELE
ISLLIPCPTGFKKTPNTVSQDCKSATLQLAIKGCSFECYKEIEAKRCCPGYWGQDCIECPEHASMPCNNNGVCSDGMGGNGTCSCKFCNTIHCLFLFLSSFHNFVLVCTCVHGLCNAGVRGDGICTCFSGYKGPNCDQELPECAALSCPENSRCMEEALTGKLVCRCKTGYQMSGTECISINPCLQSICHPHATCVHTGPNKHLCTCAEGYSGDGRVCMGIDPCQTNHGGCSALSTRCVYDGPGKFHCECLAGFDNLERGVSCSLKEACKPDSCHKNANCTTVAPERVECTCHHGYLGNGKVCYGNIMQRLNDLNTEPGGQWTGQLSSLSWPLRNLGPFTVFIPINKGFRGTSPKTIMADSSKAKYWCKLHMVAGEIPFDTLKKMDVYYTLTGKAGETDTTDGDAQTKIRIHGSRKKGTILQSDVIASNGMIHIISKLMDSVSPTVESDKEVQRHHIPMSTILHIHTFSNGEERQSKTNMASLMDLPGPFTVFAPTSTAFDAMMEGHLQYLSSAEGYIKLVELLRNHIVASSALEVYNVVSSPRVVTRANQVLSFNVTENGQILVNGMAVLEADVEAKNGRLYSVDGVLIPSSIEPVLPHRCDTTETKIVKVRSQMCHQQPYHIHSAITCICTCSLCAQTPACCRGFYGPECSMCPGGFQTPCSGHGQCMEGIEGNGTCICEPNFRGSRCQYCSSPNKYGPNCDKTCTCIHGQCDNRPEADGRCKVDSCMPGYTGVYCERQTRACGVQVEFCHAHADCDFNQGATKCVCKPGYEGDGIICVEKDPCALPLRGGCSINAKCTKTGPGTHSCQCLAGWREDGDECQPINTCNNPDRGGCHPNATCIYIGPGQSQCMCKVGYRGDGRDCVAVNQCVTQNGGCHYLVGRKISSS